LQHNKPFIYEPFGNDAKLTDAVEKGVFIIETADPMHALKTLRMLSRRECWVRRRFSTPSTPCETFAPTALVVHGRTIV
jgi:hypothetical protein